MVPSPSRLSRRSVFAGASAVGAIAAVAVLAPTIKGAAAPDAQRVLPAPDKGGGYQLSEHVKRYYKTTLV